jgi:uncharacterized protein YbjT (DUF2867 family)
MIVVIGATGTIGRHLVELLHAEATPLRAISRDPGAAALPPGVEVVAGDPARPPSMAPLLDGATAVFLHPRAAAAAPARLLAMARDRGVRRVVALAAGNVDDPLDHQPSRFRGDRNKEVEDAAIGSGLEWTSLRPTSFAANSAQAWGAQIRAGDVVRGVYPGFHEAPIDELDVAEVAARALLGDELLGRRLTLTGPRSLSHAEMVGIIGEQLGRPLRYLEVSPEAATQAMLAQGMPEPFLTALMARYARDLDRPAATTDEVAKALGRPAGSFAHWVARNAAAFRAVR